MSARSARTRRATPASSTGTWSTSAAWSLRGLRLTVGLKNNSSLDKPIQLSYTLTQEVTVIEAARKLRKLKAWVKATVAKYPIPDITAANLQRAERA